MSKLAVWLSIFGAGAGRLFIGGLLPTLAGACVAGFAGEAIDNSGLRRGWKTAIVCGLVISVVLAGSILRAFTSPGSP